MPLQQVQRHTHTHTHLYASSAPPLAQVQDASQQLTAALTYGRFLITKLPSRKLLRNLADSRRRWEQRGSLCRIQMTVFGGCACRGSLGVPFWHCYYAIKWLVRSVLLKVVFHFVPSQTAGFRVTNGIKPMHTLSSSMHEHVCVCVFAFSQPLWTSVFCCWKRQTDGWLCAEHTQTHSHNERERERP